MPPSFDRWKLLFEEGAEPACNRVLNAIRTLANRRLVFEDINCCIVRVGLPHQYFYPFQVVLLFELWNRNH
jgi:hypothetical protein